MTAELKRQFVDTNILVYAHDIEAGDKHGRARALIAQLWESGQGHLSVQVLQEFFVAVTTKVKKPLEIRVASRLISWLANWKVHSPNAHDVIRATEIQERHKVSFWDAMIIRSAESLGCDVIWSEDLNHGQRYENVLVLNPFLQR